MIEMRQSINFTQRRRDAEEGKGIFYHEPHLPDHSWVVRQAEARKTWKKIN